MKLPDAIHLEQVGLRVGRDWLLRKIDWRVPQGACAALLGPNGSGKSTLARVLLGQQWPTEGRVSLFDQTFGQTSLVELRKVVRIVQPNALIDTDPATTTEEVVLTGFFGTINLYDRADRVMRKRSAELIDALGLTRVKGHAFGTLSTGERVRCLIARALVVRPKLLILDEPTAGLDLPAREMVMASIDRLLQAHAGQLALLMITHHLEELPQATSTVLLLKDGRAVAAGRPAGVLTGKRLSQAYDCAVQVRRVGGRYHWSVKRLPKSGKWMK